VHVSKFLRLLALVFGVGETKIGDLQAPNVWLPNVEPSGLAALLGSQGRRLDDVKVTLSPNGGYRRTIGPTRYECPMSFKRLARAKTWGAAEVLINESLESFWGSSLNAGRPIRWFADRTAATPTRTLYCASERLDPKESLANWQAYWDVDLLFVPVV